MQLHPDLSFCRIDDRFLFLDLAQDRYFSLGSELGAVFAAMIDGSATPADCAALAQRGLVVASDGTPLAPCPGPAAQRSLLDSPLPSPPIGLVLDLAWRFAQARTALHRRGLPAMATRLAAERRPRTRADADVPLLASLAAYERLCLLGGAHDLCLPRALALAIHLARRGFRAEVVFGVQLRPFSAHCWVECDDKLVNDRFDRVRLYTPIRRL
jgi:hypothetical protein